MSAPASKIISFKDGKFQLRIDGYELTNSAISGKPVLCVEKKLLKHPPSDDVKIPKDKNGKPIKGLVMFAGSIVVTVQMDDGGDILQFNEMQYLYGPQSWALKAGEHALFTAGNKKFSIAKPSYTFRVRLKMTQQYSAFHKVKKKWKEYTKTYDSGWSEWAAVTMTNTQAPEAPKAIDFEYTNAGREYGTQVWVESIQGYPTKPISSIKYQRRSDTAGSSSDWADVTGLSKSVSTIGKVSNKGTLACMNSAAARLAEATRYKWRCVVTGPTGSTTGGESSWGFTTPPQVSNTSHVRLSDSKNEIFFSRNQEYLNLGIIRGFQIEYNTVHRDDPDFDNGWKLISTSDLEKPPGHPYMDDVTVSDVAAVHKNCSADQTYSYRVRSYNYFKGSSYPGYSPWSSFKGTDTTYNTPSAPSDLNIVADANLTSVTLEVKAAKAKKYTSADRLYVQKKIGDSSVWLDVPDGTTDGVDLSGLEYTETSGPVYKFIDSDTDDMIGKTVTYRVAFATSQITRNGQSIPVSEGEGRSKWSKEESVSMLSKPNKPNLIMPVNNAKIASDSGTVRLIWEHSPTDGTSQKAVKLEYKVKTDSTWKSVTLAKQTDSFYELPITEFNPNDIVQWRVSTKGEHESYSEFNEYKFVVLSKPEITITSLNNGDVVNTLPINVKWTYVDQSGTLSELNLKVYKKGIQDLLVKLDPENPDLENGYKLSEYFFEDNTDYTISLEATSTSGLTNFTNVTFSVEYSEVILDNGFVLSTTFSEDTGFETVLVERIISTEPEPESGYEEGDEPEPEPEPEPDPDYEPLPEPDHVNDRVRRFYLYRVSDRGTELVSEQSIDLSEYDTAVSYSYTDKYAPVNNEFHYRLVQLTETGLIGVSESREEINKTLWWYVYWGEENENVIKTKWNPQGSATLGRPSRQEVRYSGREYPVIYDSEDNDETYSYTFSLFRVDHPALNNEPSGKVVLNQFRTMMKSGGMGIWKSFEGDVYDAKFDFSYSTDYKESLPAWNCTLNVTRTEREI